MKFKNLLQILTLLALVFSLFGTSRQAQAKAAFAPAADPVIVPYNITISNATYSGTVDASRYEQWTFSLSKATSFVVTATLTSGNLVPLLTLSGTGITGSGVPAEGTIAVTLPPGTYTILIQPKSGSGSYSFTLRVTVAGLSASVVADAANVEVDDSVLVRVKLNNVPSTGLTSAEFTCTYDPAFLDVSGMSDAGLFGSDAVMVVKGPADGTFILALAGSNGNKATTSGDAFVFYATGLQAGQTSIECAVRVSKGDKILTEIPSTPAGVTVVLPSGILAGKAVAGKPVTVKVYDSNNAVVATPTLGSDGSFSVSLPVGSYTVTASAEGYLDAQGPATITNGVTTTLPTASLLAGDIDGNDVIDQFDAMTIGMSYNTPVPAAADLNNDANIDVLDLELLAANYRKTGPTAW